METLMNPSFFHVLVFALLAVMIGLAFTFSGYRFFRFLLPIWAFVVGLVGGAQFMASLFNSPFLSTSLGLVIGLLTGVGFALISYLYVEIMLIVFGGMLGYLLVEAVWLAFGIQGGFIPFILALLAGVATAMLFAKYKMPKFLIMAGTALGGSAATIAGVMALFGKINPNFNVATQTNVLISQSVFWIITWIVLATFGVASQLTTEQQIETLKEEFDVEAFMNS